MITLSYSTINNCLQPNNSHCWINKQLGRQMPDNESKKIGREIHKIIQARIQTGDYEELRGFRVETKDFDEKMRISTEVGFHKNLYEIMGFVDGKRKDDLLEIKTGTDFWPITKFRNSMQIGLYALITDCKRVFCMTALSDMGAWKMQPPKIYEVEITQKMKDKVDSWIFDAIELYEKGDFTGGLTNGRCEGYCSYGQNCYFK